MAEKELTAAQRNAKRLIGRLERRIKRTNDTQAKRKDQVKKLRSKL
jgi:hypothetical protein